VCQADLQTFEFSITADGSITFDLTSFRQFIFGSNGFTGTDRRFLSFQLFKLHLLYGTVAHANNDNADADADAQAGADGVQGVPMQDDNEPPPAPAPAPAPAAPKVQPVPQPAAQQQYLTHEDVDVILSKYDERRLQKKDARRKEEEAKQLVRTHIQTDDVWEQCFR
jgi:hypothetical protein